MKFLIATGGSGGHIFPALYLAQELKARGHQIYFAGVFGGFKVKIENEGFVCQELSARGLRTENLKSMLISFFCMLKSIIESLAILRKFQPDAVIGFGGYGAFPAVLMAAVLQYPTMLHEQNVWPGRANAVLGNVVDKVAVSFENGKGFFPKKTVWTGCPCRVLRPYSVIERENSRVAFGLAKMRYTILVFGGSQGSQAINANFLRTIPFLTGPLNLQVLHVAGSQGANILNAQYNVLGLPFRVFPFLDEIDKAYAAADLVISRAGAVTVHELAMCRVPAILIPYPFAGGHQTANADSLAATGMAEVIEQKDLTPEKLREAILRFSRRRFNEEDVRGKNRSLYRLEAAAVLADELVALGER